jgi:hypothetical protein
MFSLNNPPPSGTSLTDPFIFENSPPHQGSFPQHQSSQGRPGYRKRDAAGRDVKTEPSAASGGIPNPTVEYIEAANEISHPLAAPRHLLVVIDLNGTLLYRPSRNHPTKFIDRPNARLFLKYCIETFHVVIWSSARLGNVNAMCNSIMTPELRKKCIAIWAREKFDLTATDFDRRVICYKRLTKLWNTKTIADTHPEAYLGRKWDQTNTVLIDDSVEKAKAQPFNLIEVPEWSGDMTDSVLPSVHDYLNMLSQHSNVSACLRSNPFKKPLQAIAA